MTGFISGDPLHTLFSQAGLFVLPSYHEGLPIALLEAMSWSLPVIVSDIPVPTSRLACLPRSIFRRAMSPRWRKSSSPGAARRPRITAN